MPLLTVKLIIDLACGALFAWGGFDFLAARRYIMPCVIAIYLSIVCHIYWLGLTVLPVCGTLCLGYSGTKGGYRGFWLFLQSFVIGLGLFLTGHLSWYFYLPYVIISGILGSTLFDVFQILSDSIFGCWLGMIVFIVH